MLDVIMEFETTVVLPGVQKLLQQLCFEIGFPAQNIPYCISYYFIFIYLLLLL